MINPVTLALVKSALDAGALRQVAHANNIANAGTAGYKPFAVAFEEGLGRVHDAIAAGTASQLSPADVPAASLYVDSTATAAPSLDQEVAASSENALHYQALTRALGQEYALLGLAMSGGSN
jgi:flagellar basal-body rod protein FlgB